MFGIFNRAGYDTNSKNTTTEVIDNVEETLQDDADDSIDEDRSSCYRIGQTTDGKTELSVGRQHSAHMTLTMDDGAVAQLIRMLAVNIANNYQVTVTPILNPAADDLDPTDLFTDAI